MPAVNHSGRRDHLASLGVISAALGDGADLINGMGVAGGDQLVIFSDQALSLGQGAELSAGWESVAVHGVIGLGIAAGLVVLGARQSAVLMIHLRKCHPVDCLCQVDLQQACCMWPQLQQCLHCRQSHD